MMMANVREPQKVNSKDKKRRIIDAGLKVFGEKGYYNTNTAEIAKVAGVSTGIVYSYFENKKDILLHAINLYFDNIFTPMKEFIDSIRDFSLNREFFEKSIAISIKAHQDNYTAHEEMIALQHLDEDVHNLFIGYELQITEFFVKFFEKHNIKLSNMTERMHLAYYLFEDACHDFVYHHHNQIKYDVFLKMAADSLLFIFRNN